jgi:hypothetical protein
MKIYFKWFFSLGLVVFMATTGCNESQTSKTEEVKINTMDSTSKAIKENKEKLEEQTEKVEASLEKLENEFDSTR